MKARLVKLARKRFPIKARESVLGLFGALCLATSSLAGNPYLKDNSLPVRVEPFSGSSRYVIQDNKFSVKPKLEVKLDKKIQKKQKIQEVAGLKREKWEKRESESFVPLKVNKKANKEINRRNREWNHRWNPYASNRPVPQKKPVKFTLLFGEKLFQRAKCYDAITNTWKVANRKILEGSITVGKVDGVVVARKGSLYCVIKLPN